MVLVSVIVPTFNCANYIRAAIYSVLNQTLQSFQLIIIDDGSTDGTAGVIDEFLADSRVSYIFQANRGLPGARNRGLSEARGQYVAFLDADDTLAPETLAVLANYLENNAGPHWCVTDILRIVANQQVVTRCEIPKDPFYGILASDFIARGFFFRRQSLVSVGGYDEGFKTREDWELNIRMIRSGKMFLYVPQALYHYYARSGGITLGRPDQVLADTYRLLHKHHKQLADMNDDVAKRIYSDQLWDLGRRYLYGRPHFRSSRNLKLAGRCILESLASDRHAFRITQMLRRRLSSVAGRIWWPS